MEQKITKRKPGQRKENLNDESSIEMLQNIYKFIRSDTGGKTRVTVIQKKAMKIGLEFNDEEAEFIGEYGQRQVFGSRMRVKSRYLELQRRIKILEARCKELELKSK